MLMGSKKLDIDKTIALDLILVWYFRQASICLPKSAKVEPISKIFKFNF